MYQRHHLVRSLIATSLAIPLALSAVGQSDSTSVSGAVTDATGALLPNAKVTIRNEATGTEQTINSNESGQYTVPNVRPGSYTVTVEANGFQTFKTTGVQVDASIPKQVNASMKVGDAGSSVVVEANTNTVQTESAVLGQLVTQEQVKSIQLNGRNPLFLAQMEPGVIRTSPMASFSFGLDNSIYIGGGRNQGALITLDGAPMVRTRSNGTSVGTADVDGTAQVQILSSAYPAEYGRSDGGQVRIVPKSGTSSFHGTAYEYLRNNFFNANTWQRKLPSNSLAIQQHPQAFRYNQYGFNLNGPVYIPGHWNKNKEKLFFLFGQEYVKYVVAETVFNKVPTALMRTGNFSELLTQNQNNIFYSGSQQIYHPYAAGQTKVPYANNIITDPLSPNGIALMNAFPLPNATAATYNWVDSAPNIQDQRKDTLVVDYVPSDAHRIRLTILNYAFKQTSPHNGGYNKLPQKWNRPNQVAVLHYSWNINPSTVNEAIVSVASDHVTIGVDTSSGLYDRTKYGINYPYLFGAATKDLPLKYPTISIPNTTLLDGTPYPSKSGGTVFTVGDNLTKVWGNHTAKFGASAEYAGENNKDQITVSNTPGSTNNQNGRFNFTDSRTGGTTTGIGFSNAALGLFDTYAEIGQRSYTLYRAWAYDAFAQDSWHVTPKLVVEAGIHYSFYNPYYAKWGNQSVFSPKDYNPANAATVSQTTGFVTGTQQQIYNGVVIPGSGFPSIAAGHVNADILANGYSFLFRGYDRQYSPTIKTNFQPRFGITYQVKPGTVIRAGGGRYVQRLGITDNVFTGGNAPFQPAAAVSLGVADNPGGAGTSNQYPQLYSSQAFNYPSPEAYNWNFTIEQELKQLGVLTLSYGGRKGIHLEELLNINQLQPGTLFLASSLLPGSTTTKKNTDSLRPYQGYNAINQATNGGASNYNSLQVNLRRRLTNGLLFGIAYTWSKSLDFGSSNGTKLPNTFDKNLMYGRSDFDRRHVFIANVVYNIDQFNHSSYFINRAVLGHWQISGTLQAQTGAGLGVTTGTDFAGVGSGSGSQYVIMPHATTSSKSFAGQGTTKTWFDTTAYVTSDTVLNSTYAGKFQPRGARNVISGPGFQSYNAALNKSWTLVPGHEATQLTFRAEAFNLANHPTADNPDTGYTSATFGQSKTKGQTYSMDRQFQFSLRLAF
ncbi:carboxypeptidase regulatory-like domain-containing protein [Terriglobus sp. TAA 43]|uniref:TonB-dependent receptor n=1 Tax=Terriglobus sp. TAA 43 TaxID=278961 RepID=UPI000647A640|nr:carboxypeptidase regulatory-like domain-containing protein [Terriglobus sp. TAA 43]